ncbi:MAG: Spy/CpxP family protein refolding chaperone [Deltaproteobacteria bacterium]
MKKMLLLFTFALLASGFALAQDPPAAGDPPDPPDALQPADPAPPPMLAQRTFGGPGMPGQGMGMGMNGPGMGMRGPGPGKWWKNPELTQSLGLTDDQISKMEKIFQDHRLKLIDLHAALQKQEALLEPMIEADHPDEDRVLSQIDQVAQARAELEKANARMLLDIRNVLTPDQWKKLQAERAARPRRMGSQRQMRFRQPYGGPQTQPAPPPSNPNQ